MQFLFNVKGVES